MHSASPNFGISAHQFLFHLLCALLHHLAFPEVNDEAKIQHPIKEAIITKMLDPEGMEISGKSPLNFYPLFLFCLWKACLSPPLQAFTASL